MALAPFNTFSVPRNKWEISPKKEKTKNAINPAFNILFLINNEIKNIGINSGFRELNNKLFSLYDAMLFMANSNNKAIRNKPFWPILKNFFMVDYISRLYQT